MRPNFGKLSSSTSGTNSGSSHSGKGLVNVFVLCFGLPERLITLIKGKLRANLPQEDPFWLHAVLVEAVVSFFEDAVWHCRDLVRYVEKVSHLTASISATENVSRIAQLTLETLTTWLCMKRPDIPSIHPKH